MRVAHIESGRHLYGGARQVLHLIGGLRRHGVEGTLICAAGSAIETEASSLCDVVALPLRGDLDPFAVPRLRRALAAARPDVVHVHSRRGADLYVALASLGARWRTVLSRRVDHRELAAWARVKYRPYSAVIAISRAVERELLEHVALPRERVHLIPSGVPIVESRERSDARSALAAILGLPCDAPVAAVIGQLIPRKGHGVLLDALPGVLERHRTWRVVFFGRGPLEAELRREIERRGLKEHVRLAGFRPDLAELLPGLDLVLHPASREGLGLAVLEAMSAGVPVAASAAGGLVDAIEDGVSGLLVPPDDSRAWAVAVERLVADADARRRLGEGGRRRVRAAFGVERMVSAHLALYRALLGGAPARSDRAVRPAAIDPERQT